MCRLRRKGLFISIGAVRISREEIVTFVGIQWSALQISDILSFQSELSFKQVHSFSAIVVSIQVTITT